MNTIFPYASLTIQENVFLIFCEPWLCTSVSQCLYSSVSIIPDWQIFQFARRVLFSLYQYPEFAKVFLIFCIFWDCSQITPYILVESRTLWVIGMPLLLPSYSCLKKIVLGKNKAFVRTRKLRHIEAFLYHILICLKYDINHSWVIFEAYFQSS